jgi:FAD/FMN-containing dehydrogenase/Fe-S oxidoreductase
MRDLEDDLTRVMRGEVRFDRGSRALYATDGSNYRQVPIGVVVPRDSKDVEAAMAVCREHHAPVLSRGGGTSLAGQCCNVAVVFDYTKYMRHIVALDASTRLARVEPGLVLDTLRGAAEQHHLTFAPDPSTHSHCTLGGMIGNNSCGVHSVMAGKTVENIDEMEILTYEGLRMRVGPTSDDELEGIIADGGRRGQIYAGLKRLRDRYADLIRARYPKIPRRVSGYNLDELLPENGFHVARALVGTEGTCVAVLEATARLVYSPPGRSLLVLGYPDVYQAADHILEILALGPIGLEGIDDRLVDDMKKLKMHPRDLSLLPEGGGWLLVEFGGESKAESNGRAEAAMAALKKEPHAPSMKLYEDDKQEKLIWRIRESGLGATARVPGEPVTWEGWEDSAVAPARLGEYLRELRKLFDKYQYGCCLYGHFGQGCVHTRIDFDLETREGIETYKSFMDEASTLVVSLGGSLSGEHGDGQSKAQFLPKMFGPELVEAFREFKTIWDPDGMMNPGKIVAPYRIDQNLRLGADYRPPHVATHFQFPDDRHSFAFTTTRCVGVGDCRREHGGTMCPSYRVTHDEQHSTRGRAHLLFEMLEGDPLEGGWRDEHVKDALDLCLACKGCKGDCPVQVDMASYKAEFLSHYYAGRLRPRSAYAMGYIHLWARAAALAPRFVNALMHTPFVSTALKALGGISGRRSVPRFADRTFTDRFEEKPRAVWPTTRTRVVLWPDTFNNHFHPDTAMAAADVLAAAGCEVVLPSRPLCCGRALYDFGFLGAASRLLRDTLQELRPHLEAGTPIVVLEPSCLAVFRDELPNLFPDDEDAKRLSGQAVLLSEFLRKVPGYEPPRLAHDVILHGHCHHKAIAKLEDEEALLRDMTAHVNALDSGCCGMAGSFGFEAEHYDIAMDIGELVLLPAVRSASNTTLIVADGFSCREQIEQATGRRAVHLAEAIAGALHEVRMDGRAAVEDGYLPARRPPPAFPREIAAAACIGIGIGMAALEWRRGHRHGGSSAALSRSA